MPFYPPAPNTYTHTHPHTHKHTHTHSRFLVKFSTSSSSACFHFSTRLQTPGSATVAWCPDSATAELIPGKKPSSSLWPPAVLQNDGGSSWFTSQTLLWSQSFHVCLSIPPEQFWPTLVPLLLLPRRPNNIPCLRSCSSYSLTLTPSLVCSVVSSQASLCVGVWETSDTVQINRLK